jgi:hypothetical protein
MRETYLCPTTGRPTRESISRELGFKAPIRFADFVSQVYDFGLGDPTKCRSVFDAVLGICYPDGIDCRYAGTPSEFFPIGSIGCDGVHYGYLAVAPELLLDELPIGYYGPMDSDGVVLAGRNTEEGIASTMADFLSYEFIDAERKDLIQRFAAYTGIELRKPQTTQLLVPKGWQHLPSKDGVGSLGPVEWFSEEPIFDISKWTMPEEYVWAADVFIKKCQFGTALHYLREGLWRYCWEGNRMIGERTCELYRLMGREPLAEVLEWTMTNRWNLRAS